MPDTVAVKVTAEFDLDSKRKIVDDFDDMIAGLEKKAVEIKTESMGNVRDLAKSRNDLPPSNMAAANRYVRSFTAPAASQMGSRAPSWTDLGADLGDQYPKPVHDFVANQIRGEQNAAELKATKEQRKQADQNNRDARSSNAGLADRFLNARFHGADVGIIQREQDAIFLNSPTGQQDQKNRINTRADNIARDRILMKQAQPAARKRMAAETGITLPEDMSGFSKTLQDTFKSATSLGMLEALSGGSAAPLARAFATHVIGGMLLPGAIEGLNMLTSGAGRALGSLFGGASKGVASGAASGVSSVITSAGGTVAGNAATGALAGATGTEAAAATAPEAAAGGGLAAMGPIGLLIGAVGLLTGGLGLYMNAQIANKNQMEEQLWAAVGGKNGSPNNFIDSVTGNSNKYFYSPTDVATTSAQLGNMGISGIQSLSNNTENALMLSRAIDPSAKTPNAALTSLVGSLATSGGASGDDITKMIGLMEVQNSLTKDQKVPLDIMATNLANLIQNTGGIPTNAGTVASLATISHTFAAMGPAGQHLATQAGNVMAPIMGATGTNLMAASAILHMPIDTIVADQTSKNPKGMLDLFHHISQFVKSSTAGVTDPGQKNALAEVQLQSFGGILGGSGLGQTDLSTYVKALMSDNPAAMGKTYDKIFGGTPAPADVKTAATVIVSNTVSIADQAINKGLTDLLTAAKNASTALATANILLANQNRLTAELVTGGSGPGNRPAWNIPTPTPSPTPTPGTPTPTPGGPPKPSGTPTPVPGGSAANISIPFTNSDGTKGTAGITQPMYDAAVAASKKTGIPTSVLLAQWAREGHVAPQGGNGGLGQFTPGATQWVDQNVKGLSGWNPSNETAATGFLAMASYDTANRKVENNNLAQMIASYNGGTVGLAQNTFAQQYSSTIMANSKNIVGLPSNAGGGGGGPIIITIVDQTKGGIKVQGSQS
jgi:hypothetical protein